MGGADSGRLAAAGGRVAALVEGDDDKAVVLVGRRGHDLRHPLRQERVGLASPPGAPVTHGASWPSLHRSGEMKENAA